MYICSFLLQNWWQVEGNIYQKHEACSEDIPHDHLDHLVHFADSSRDRNSICTSCEQSHVEFDFVNDVLFIKYIKFESKLCCCCIIFNFNHAFSAGLDGRFPVKSLGYNIRVVTFTNFRFSSQNPRGYIKKKLLPQKRVRATHLSTL